MVTLQLNEKLREILSDEDSVRELIYAESTEEVQALLLARNIRFTQEDIDAVGRIVEGFLTGELTKNDIGLCDANADTGLLEAAAGTVEYWSCGTPVTDGAYDIAEQIYDALPDTSGNSDAVIDQLHRW